jgi:two-component system chemotaxis response regulator CheB
MPPHRLTVVIAEDSALYRQMLLNILQRIPGVEVVGTAVDGLEAVEKVVELRPDVLTLDVQMPRLDGLGVLRHLRARGSGTRVIMVSSLTAEGAPTTVEALMEGAFDVVEKPVGLDPHLARGSIHEALLEKLSALVDARHASPVVGGAPAARASGRIGRQAIAAVAIGTSTGGPQALRDVIPRLPANLPVPLFVVQHMPAGFTASLAVRLNEIAPARVVEASQGMVTAAGCVHVAAGGQHLTVEHRGNGNFCRLDAGPMRLGCRPSFDALLESLVPVYGGKLLAVVLTGMGQDGLAGCRVVKAAGGRVIAQAAAGCAVYGMPKAVVEAGLADAVVPLEGIAAIVTASVHGGAAC